MEPKLYYTKDKEGNPRHVVVVTSEQTEDGKVQVERLGLHPSVEGRSRRGRPPNFSNVDFKDLALMDEGDVTSELQQEAKRKLASSAKEDGQDGDSPLN